MEDPDIITIKKLIDEAKHIVIIQADNPDADSLGSALALEELLEENLGKQTTLYCGVNMPGYLSYISGQDRVTDEFPKQFDLSIIVDASTKTLLGKLDSGSELSWVAAKPVIVIDHHESVQNPIDFAEVNIINTNAAATGAMIAELSKRLAWDITPEAANALLVSILGDTQGLSNSLATADTYRVCADLIEAGADRVVLEEKRREQSKMPRKIYEYKATLIQRTKFAADGKLAYVRVPQQEIKDFSPLYNPAPLIQNDMLQTEGVQVALVFKTYDSGRVTGSLRCNSQAAIANTLAEAFGGGGHPYAAGFKVESSKNVDELMQDVIEKAEELLREAL